MRWPRLQFDLSTLFVAVAVAAMICVLFRWMGLDAAGLIRCAAATVVMTLVVFVMAIVMLRIHEPRCPEDESLLAPLETIALVIGIPLIVWAFLVIGADPPPHLREYVLHPFNLSIGAAFIVGWKLGRIGGEGGPADVPGGIEPPERTPTPLPRWIRRMAWIAVGCAVVAALACFAVCKLLYQVAQIPDVVALESSSGLTGEAVVWPRYEDLAVRFAATWPVWLLLAGAIYDATRLSRASVGVREATLRLTRIGASQCTAALILSLQTLFAWYWIFSFSGDPTPRTILRNVAYVRLDVLPPWVVLLAVVGATYPLVAGRRRELLIHAGWMYAAAAVGVMNTALYTYWSLCEIVTFNSR